MHSAHRKSSPPAACARRPQLPHSWCGQRHEGPSAAGREPADRGNAPAEFGKVCDVQRANNCTLRVVLSLACPPRQLAYPQTLDVGVTPRGREVIAAGVPATCKGESLAEAAFAGAEPPTLPWEAYGPNARSDTLHVSLTHGTLALGGAEVSLASPAPGCTASAEGEGVLRRGGVLRAVDTPLRLRLVCRCAVERSVNLTLTMRLSEWTTPVVSFPHVCAGASDGGGRLYE